MKNFIGGHYDGYSNSILFGSKRLTVPVIRLFGDLNVETIGLSNVILVQIECCTSLAQLSRGYCTWPKESVSQFSIQVIQKRHHPLTPEVP